jgi:hypothetical protein
MLKPISVIVASGLLVALAMQVLAQENSRVLVAELDGKPIFRDDLPGTSDQEIAKALQTRIGGAIFEQFISDNAKELKVSDAEIDQAAKYFSERHAEKMALEAPALKKKLAELTAQVEAAPANSAERRTLETQRADIELQLDQQPPSRETVKFILTYWKYQNVLYKKYNGGRLLWQQMGIEAFDATRVLLETAEKKGRFKILAPKIRDEFYFYWTKQNHGAFLIEDAERIRKEFLEPEWLPKSSVPAINP